MLRRNRYRILAARIFINLFALAALALVALAVFYLLSELQPQLRDEERCDVIRCGEINSVKSSCCSQKRLLIADKTQEFFRTVPFMKFSKWVSLTKKCMK